MKKTIAILLVLVIGLAGIFADGTTHSSSNTDQKQMTIKALILGIDNMIVKPLDKAAPVKNTHEDWVTEAVETTISSDAETLVGMLYTRSNNSSGYQVTMDAGRLESETLFLEYTAKAYDLPRDSAVGDLSTDDFKGESTNTGGVNGSSDDNTIIVVGSLGEISMEERLVTVTIPDFDTAQAGSYTGTITFTYIGN